MARVKGSKGVEGSKPHGPARPDSVKLKLSIDRETARLLRLEAFGRDCSLGQVVTELVRASPRRFVLTDRLKGSAGPEVPGQDRPEGSQRPRGEAGAFGVVSEAG
jgi:hypothetical protein